MRITEHNCEEYFLLYVDDELSNIERSAVELFVQQHPQYKVALDALLKTKLPLTKEDAFFNKNSLFKNEEKEIGSHNYEDYFLLYTDNELNQEEKEATERFVLQHPQLQAEFMLLQQTRLPVEIIAFEGKEKLHKKERRIIPMYVTRLAIAASLIGVVSFSWLLFFSHQPHLSVAVVKPVVLQQKAAASTGTNVPQTTSVTSSDLVIVKKNEQKQTIKTVSSTPKTNRLQQSNDDKNEVAIDDKINSKPATITNAVTAPEVTQTAMHKEPIAAANKTAETLKPLEEVNMDDTHTQNALLVSADDNTAKPAVYKELNTDDDAHTLYVASLQLNKAKVAGILKTASRLFGGKTKQNVD